MITLITSKIPKRSPDLELLQQFEQFCSLNSNWKTKKGPVLFSPRSISSRMYTLFHTLLHPVLRNFKKQGAVLSLGLPYPLYLYAKNFPYFSINSDLKVLWTYDVWQPVYTHFENLVRQSGVNLLLLSSREATAHFRKLNIPGCEVHWVPETINTEEYTFKPWHERSTNILSFGRSWLTYHDAIADGCAQHHIEYAYQERNQQHDVAVHGLRSRLQFPTWTEFISGLANAQLCICFPRSTTHPALAGNVSTLTVRYLQAMASKCLIIGASPEDAAYLFDYNPVVEVDWTDPVGQIQDILAHPEPYQALIERNYKTVCEKFHHKNAVAQIEELINHQLSRP